MEATYSALGGLVAGLLIGHSLTNTEILFKKPSSALNTYTVYGTVRSLDPVHHTLVVNRSAPSTALRLTYDDANTLWATILRTTGGSHMRATRSEPADARPGTPVMARVKNDADMTSAVVTLYPQTAL